MQSKTLSNKTLYALNNKHALDGILRNFYYLLFLQHQTLKGVSFICFVLSQS